MSRPILAIFSFLVLARGASAGPPFPNPSDPVDMRIASPQPVINYTLRVNIADLSAYEVEMRLRNVPDTFRVAMATHPEYDDRFWRYVEGFRVEARGGRGSLLRQDSALWRVTAPGGEAVLRYRIHLPVSTDSMRAAYRPFLAPTGGLVGGPHSFMYVVGATRALSHVKLELPAGWSAVTGLEPAADPNAFSAANADVLIDSPILVGLLKSWHFSVDGVPHRVAYWPRPDAAAFDTGKFVSDIRKLVRQAVALFGRPDYREYSFLFQDGAFGALEHRNSVTIGARSALLAEDPTALLGTIAHEFFHAWNMIRIHPAEFGDVNYGPAPRSRDIWWSEGVTIFYADLLRRRAGLAVPESTRVAHLERLLAWYFGSPGNSLISPERVSLFAFAGPPDSLGDFSPSTHLQGELLGTMLDLIVRDATDGRRSADDVMRAMCEHFSGEHGFSGDDIERTVAGVCGCEVHSFFETYVRGGNPIDFDKYLQLIGLHLRVSWNQAIASDGHPEADLRAYAWQPMDGSGLRMGISNPSSCWGKAGLHTGDQILAVNGGTMGSTREFRAMLGRLRVGDTVAIEVRRPAGTWRTSVFVAGYERPSVKIEEIATATERQRKLRGEWIAGEP